MKTYEEATEIALSHKKDDEIVDGFAETDEVYIFSIETEENLNDPTGGNKSKYVFTVNKESGDFGSMSFFEWADAVKAGKVKRFAKN